MKKLIAFFAIIIASLFIVSCDKEDVVQPEEPTLSRFHLMVFAEDENIGYCVFTAHTNPQIDNLTERAMNKENGKFEFKFALKLEDYEDQVFKISILASNCHESPCKVYKDSEIVRAKPSPEGEYTEIIFEVGD